MIRTFFNRLHGYHVQYNIVSRETLIDAQLHPEKHKDPIVRVAGYSAFFNVLSKKTQDDIASSEEPSRLCSFSYRKTETGGIGAFHWPDVAGSLSLYLLKAGVQSPVQEYLDVLLQLLRMQLRHTAHLILCLQLLVFLFPELMEREQMYLTDFKFT